MSYKTDLQANNTRLNTLKTEINNLPTFIDTTDANATAGDILSGKSGYVNGVKVNGSLETETKTVKSTTASQTITPTAGKLINEITVEPMELEQITVIPSETQQVITPSQNKDGISQITVEKVEWRPQPDWWDIKTIVENDTENYPYKIICLHDDSVKTEYWQWPLVNATRLVKIKLSDGQEISSAGIYTVGDNGFKSCSKGYKTCYSIWYFNDFPNFSYTNIGDMFRHTRYIYLYNITQLAGLSNFYWYSEASPNIEAIESNKQISTTYQNMPLLFSYNCTVLHKLPEYIWNRINNTTTLSNIIQFIVAPNLSYENISKIIKNRSFIFTSGYAPVIQRAFYGKTIDFETDWGIDTTLFTRLNDIIGPYAIKKINCENVITFNGICAVSEIYEISNIKITNNYFRAVSLSHDTFVRILNALYDYSESSDTYTLTIGSFNLNKLTIEEKAIATNKGWTLA